MGEYEKLKVTELKELLKARAIPSTGLTRKAQIIEALEKHDAEAGEVDPPVAEGSIATDAEQEDRAQHTAVGADDVHGTAPTTGEEKEAAENGANGNAQEVKARGSLAQEGNAENREEVLEEVPPLTDAPIEDQKEDVAPLEPPAKASAEDPEQLKAGDATPRQSSLSAEEPSSDTRKRKRRSPTPPLSAETVSKKLKAAEGDVPQLPEDLGSSSAPTTAIDKTDEPAMEDTPLPENGLPEDGDKVIPPANTSDDMTDVETSQPQQEYHQTKASADIVMDEVDKAHSTPPALHPATRALYIRDLLRPLQQPQLREHLISLSAPPGSVEDQETLETLHLDTLKTHAFALFTSVTAATRVRSRMHGQVWPMESTRKPLWVDFVPEQQLPEWIELEQKEGGSRSNAKRWEVVYETSSTTGVTAELREALPGTLARQGSFGRQPSFSTGAGPGVGAGMPGAPSGPRGGRASATSNRSAMPSTSVSREEAPMAERSEAFTDLDTRFPSTTAKPKIYFLPADKELVDRRLDAFDAETSRTWTQDRAPPDASTNQLRRYTFEDGDRLVDGGADFGNFGRNSGAGGGDSFRPSGPPRGRGGRYRR